MALIAESISVPLLLAGEGAVVVQVKEVETPERVQESSPCCCAFVSFLWCIKGPEGDRSGVCPWSCPHKTGFHYVQDQ